MAEFHNKYPLKSKNTFGIDVFAEYFFSFDSIDEIISFLKKKSFQNFPILILGGGSNLLFTKNFNGLVIYPQIKGISIFSENENFAYVKANCGEIWDDLVEYTVSNNLGGLENLSLIPGNVGASPVQNIGAYGSEVKDTIESVEALNIETLELTNFSNTDCKFGYRESIFKKELKDKYIVTSVTFKLLKKPVLNTCYGNVEDEVKKIGDTNLKNIRQAIINIRSQKLPDPSKLGNAGSFFKNPIVSFEMANSLKLQYPNIPVYPFTKGKVKLAAGWLIDQCGLKGKRAGNVGVHDTQALVLINYQNSTGLEILHFSNSICETVLKKFNIQLELEVQVI